MQAQTRARVTRKFTRGNQKKILEYLRAGHYAKVAAARLGIDESTYYRWLQRGEATLKAAAAGEPVAAKDRQYARFVERVREAEAEAEQTALRRVLRSEDWRATAWFLERRHPGRWARRQGVDVTSKGQPIRTVEVVRTVGANADRP